MFNADYHFQDLIKDCSNALEAGFNATKIYADTFQELHQFYVENEHTDVDALEADSHGTLFALLEKKGMKFNDSLFSGYHDA